MLGNKKFNMVLSIVLAICLWAYVVGEINPIAERTVKNVEIKFTNSEVIEQYGLAMSKSSAYSIDVQISGSRAEISRIDSDDISATVDLSSALKGENELNVSVKAPDGVSVTKKSMSKVSVTIEDLDSKEVPVTISYTGELEKPNECETVSTSFDTVEVKGAESLVRSVTEASGKIDVSKVGEEATKNVCDLTPVDKNGKKVERVELSNRSVVVESIISKIKTVKLNVTVTDNSTDGLNRKVSMPKEVILAGRSSDLKKIDSITADAIDITNVSDGSKIVLNLNLPEGIILSEKNDDMVAVVSAESLIEKSFTFSSQDIDLQGASESGKYSFDSDFSVTVTIRDKKSVIDSISKDDITITADVSGLDSGTYSVKLSAKCKKNVLNIELSRDTGNITVE